jgi:hypothetical protein
MIRFARLDMQRCSAGLRLFILIFTGASAGFCWDFLWALVP